MPLLKLKTQKKTHSKLSIVDLAFIVSLSTVSTWMLAPHSLYFTHGKVWIALLCAAFIPFYRGKTESYFISTFFGFLACSAIFFAYTKGGGDWWPLFLAAFLWQILQGATITAISFLVWETVLSRLLEKKSVRSGLWWTLVVIAGSWALSTLLIEDKVLDRSSSEVHKRTELLNLIGEAISSTDIVEKDLPQELLKLEQHAKLIYGNNPESELITHGYGGQVVISVKGASITVDFLDIPSGNPCHSMYFLTPPFYFNEITVNGINTQAENSIETIKQELCFSNESPVTVSFRTDLEHIKDMHKMMTDALNTSTSP